MTFVCYIHIPGSPTPHMRLIEGSRADLAAELRRVIEEWPRLDHIEVYDDLDQRVLDIGQAPSFLN
jgi:hypothetical protein